MQHSKAIIFICIAIITLIITFFYYYYYYYCLYKYMYVTKKQHIKTNLLITIWSRFIEEAWGVPVI